MTWDSRGAAPTVIPAFYYTDTLRYLITEGRQEIRRRLSDAPKMLRQTELLPQFSSLGEIKGDPAWDLFKSYLDKIEYQIAGIVSRHTPSFWFHLYRRIRPTLSSVQESKTDDVTVVLVRRIAELSFAKHGDLERTADLGPIIETRLETFLDGTWYNATALSLGSKLKAKKRYREIKQMCQIVMTDFRASDLYDLFGIEGLCYEYWWASAVMRSVGKGSTIRFDARRNPPVSYKDDVAHPFCFDLYDCRTEGGTGFYTRMGTWFDEPDDSALSGENCRDKLYFAALVPNPALTEHLIWDSDTGEMREAQAMANFGIGTFPIAKFATENAFMGPDFKEKHGLELNAVLFAVWAASFFCVFTGLIARLPTHKARMARTMTNWNNLSYRGYSMVAYNIDQFATEAIWWARHLNLSDIPSLKDAKSAFDFISLTKAGQKSIGLWSGGKRPILIPSLGGFMVDLAAIVPFLYLIFFGLKKSKQVGGLSFEEATRDALRSRGFEIVLQGKLKWVEGGPREVDAAVRLGEKLILIECFSYELPLDYEIGKPSIFERRKKFIADKIEQARTLAERISQNPKGTNFDVSWAKEIDWRVVSPFVEFAWGLNEPFFDEPGLPRVMQIEELLNNISDGKMPAKSCLEMLKTMRGLPMADQWH